MLQEGNKDLLVFVKSKVQDEHLQSVNNKLLLLTEDQIKLAELWLKQNGSVKLTKNTSYKVKYENNT